MVELKYPPPKEFLEPETRNDYFISKEMKEVWAVQLDLLQELLRVCEKHNLQVFADSGTLLGAIRHGGYIPWDDDMDFSMTRCDFEKLCCIAVSEFVHPYTFQSGLVGDELMCGHAKLRNENTTAIQRNEINRNFTYSQGIFIDIFPLDNVPSNSKKYFLQKKSIDCLRFLSFCCAYFSSRYFESKNLFLRYPKMIVHILLGGSLKKIGCYLYQKMICLCKRYNQNHTDKVSLLSFASMRKPVLRKNYSCLKFVPFEFLKIPVMGGYECVLESLYGRSWRIPRTDGFGNAHGEIIWNVDKSSNDYLRQMRLKH